MAENTVRQPLSAVDEANAMVQLAGLGMTDDEIAASFARHPSAVKAAKSIAEASDKGKFALAEVKPADGVQLSIEQAAAVAKFGGTSAGKQLMIEIQSGSRYWKSTYEKLLRKEAIDADAKEITKAHKGVKKVAAFSGTWEGPEKTVEPLVNLTDAKGKALTTAGHKSCPGHAYSVEKPETWGVGTKCKVAYWCTDWKANGHKVAKEAKRTWSRRGKEASPSRGGKPVNEKTAAEERALDVAWGDATARRIVFITEFADQPKSGDKWTLIALNLALNERLELEGDWEKLSLKELVTAIIKSYVLDAEYILDDWRWSQWNRNEPIALLKFLADNGHELADVEKMAIERAEAGTGWVTTRTEVHSGDTREDSDPGYLEDAAAEDDDFDEDDIEDVIDRSERI